MKQKQINQNWKEFELGEITECLDNERIPITGSDREKGEIPYYGANGQQDSVADFIFDEELLLLAEDGGSWGYKQKCSYVIAGKSWVNNHAHVLRMKKDSINIKLLMYWFNLTDLNKYISGTTRGKLNQGVMKKIKISLPILADGTPDLKKQKQIVAILENAEGLKDKRKGLDELFDEYLKSVFYEMFLREKGKFERVELGKIVRIINGRAYKQKELLDEGPTPVLRVGNFFSNKNWYYSDLELEEDKYCSEGDFLYAWSASFGPRIWHGPKVIYHYHIWKMDLSEKVNKLYLLHLLEEKTKEIKLSGHGITMIHVTKSGMEAMKVPLPPIELQEKFASIVEHVEKIKDKLKDEKKDADELFNALMQKAFSGELV
jgi:type I restriction enzyme, S subunit